MKQLPVGVTDFGKLVRNDCVYVDKTQLLYNLVTGSGEYYFLSRPRRFGKSLLVSTLKELFLGNRTVFKDLWIDASGYDWQKHPVIHLDFSRISTESAQELKEELCRVLDDIAASYNVDLAAYKTPTGKFDRLITQLAHIAPVVILVDEYDKPILDHLDDSTQAKRQRLVLRNLYSVIKGVDVSVRFVLFTGVSKFAHMTLFSGLNNLADLSMDPRYAVLLGYTHSEIEHYFDEHIKHVAHTCKLPKSAVLERLSSHYDGYRFAKASPQVFNPYSVLRCLESAAFEDYWVATGLTTFLVHCLKNNCYDLSAVNQPTLKAGELGAFEFDAISLPALLFQTGYLTIKAHDEISGLYTLDFPNHEVGAAFSLLIAGALAKFGGADSREFAVALRGALRANDMQLLEQTLQSIMNKIPYTMQPRCERDFQWILYSLYLLLGVDIDPEVTTSRGRADLVVTIPGRVFIFELKFGKSAEQALAQIQDKKYYEMYLNTGSAISLVGIGVESETRTVTVAACVVDQ